LSEEIEKFSRSAQSAKNDKDGLMTFWLGAELKAAVQGACRTKHMSQSMVARWLFADWLRKQGIKFQGEKGEVKDQEPRDRRKERVKI
jgi:hypothetical protein